MDGSLEELCELHERLAKKGVKYVRVLWTAASNIHRVRVIPIAKFFDTIVRSGISIASAVYGLPYHTDTSPSDTGLTATGEFQYLPDLTTIKQLNYNETHAMVLGSLTKKGMAVCPRSILKKTVKQAMDEFGLSILCGFEFEFMLLKNFPGEIQPLDEHSYSESRAVYTAGALIDGICTALTAQGIDVCMAHPEACKGQYEIVTGPSDPLTCADNSIFTREAIYEVAHQHGVHATMCPKVFDGLAGCSQHCHMSIWKDGRNLIPDPSSKYNLHDTGRKFIAGVLHNLPAVMAVTMPTANSYKRIVPHLFAGVSQIWGFQNREAPIRLCCPAGGDDQEYTNFELKSVDGTCSPYLALAAIIEAGLDGIRHNRELPAPVTDVELDSKDKGAYVPLPRSISESLDCFDQCEALQNAFGDFAKVIAAIRRNEIEGLKQLTDDEHRLLICKHF